MSENQERKRPPLASAACPPRERLGGATVGDIERIIRWHEHRAELAMNALHCGSENDEYRLAHRAADAYWCAAAALRLYIGRED